MFRTLFTGHTDEVPVTLFYSSYATEIQLLLHFSRAFKTSVAD